MDIRQVVLICIASLVLSVVGADATTTKEVFAKYPNKYFIETGSLYGDGCQMALDAGFKYVYTIELAPHLYRHCVQRFDSNPQVKVLQGDSTYLLPQILREIDAPATFWLDGHYSWGETARGDTNTPIFAELEAIRQHPIKTHTILIDDVREFGTIEFDYIELDEIIEKIMEINPNYRISFEDGHCPHDVLVAEIPEK